ncbi:aspartic peptidase A1 [Mycena rebaudengoi]|nr:aspartic peptidase A1 [Mycena rebaudengoi]
MHSFIPLSLLLTVLDVVQAIHLPFTVRFRSTTPKHRLSRRVVPVSNHGNAEYLSTMNLGGTNVSVILDTGSSDLWVNFPASAAPTTKDLGKSLDVGYAVGHAKGTIHTAQLKFDGYTVEDQAFLLVDDKSSFSTDPTFNGLVGLGPNEGSRIRDKVDSAAGDSMLTRIFQQSKTSQNYISFKLDRNLADDPVDTFTGAPITSQTKLNVDSVHRLLEDQQHWQAMTDKNSVIGPDGNVINVESIVPKAPDGQLVAFSQVPRELADAIYGRVKGAIYNTTEEYWTVPCGQMLNLSFSFGGKVFPMHPLDVVDDNFIHKGDNCIGAFQPITTAFSLFGNFDMILGMTFRDKYNTPHLGPINQRLPGTSNDRVEPYIQLLSTTDAGKAHAEFVKERLEGKDTSGDAQWALLPADQQQHSPVSDAEKKAKYQEMILSRWPYILTGCLVFVALVVGLIIWKCCCRRGKKNRRSGKSFVQQQQSQTYLPLQVPVTPNHGQVNHGQGYGYGR